MLDFDPGMPLKALASRFRGQIVYVASDAKDRLGVSAVLVRPDGVVAWAGESAAVEHAARAASRWFGGARP